MSSVDLSFELGIEFGVVPGMLLSNEITPFHSHLGFCLLVPELLC
jgi:hypothetical protein